MINYFVYPHHSSADKGSHCLFDILIKSKEDSNTKLEGVIFSAGIKNEFRHPSRLAINKVYEYFKNSGVDYTE